MIHKINFDRKSLNFRLWTYFAIFALLLMAILWFLQIFFLNTYYQDMKIRQTERTAQIIQREFGSDDFIDTVIDLSIANDMYIHIETFGGTIVFRPETEDRYRPLRAYVYEMSRMRAQLLNSSELQVSAIIPEPRTDTNIFAFAKYLVNDPPFNQVILYIFTPLYPVASTIAILRTQLIYVTIISLLLAFALSYYLSRRVTRPIREIIGSAKNLADGNYNVRFSGGNFTEITDLANTLTYAASRLEKTDSLQKDLMANVSHDLRTPLTMIKSYAEMVRDLSGDNPEKREAHLNVIIEEADRLNLLVGDILTLSRAQSGFLPLSMMPFNVKNAISNLLQSYELYCEREGYTITLLCDDDLAVTADQEKIKQVITNLLNNALKYCGDDKQVIISARRVAASCSHLDYSNAGSDVGQNAGSDVSTNAGTGTGANTAASSKVRFEVIDFGVGIPESEIQKIWERYQKAGSNLVRSTTGTGLGLSIVKEILVLHNARFGVKSKPGEGSTFWFEL